VLPALIERARKEVALARVVGKFTVKVGVRKLQRQLAGRNGSADETVVDDLDPPIDLYEHVLEAASTVASTSMTTTSIRADDLVLPDYDHLPAAHIVAKLPSLTQLERDAVEEYESANRHRRTILGKLDQLRVTR
jgi:hypothetical protein